VPPQFGILRPLHANVVIVNLTNEKHGATATRWHVIALNPQWHSEKLALFFRRLANDLDDVGIVLTLAIHQLERAEPANHGWKINKLDQHCLVSLGQNLERVSVGGHSLAAKIIGRDWDAYFHDARSDT
jgi:hypothetical protein